MGQGLIRQQQTGIAVGVEPVAVRDRVGIGLADRCKTGEHGDFVLGDAQGDGLALVHALTQMVNIPIRHK